MVILRAWPFVLDELVQPVIIKAFRPVNVAGLNIVSYDLDHGDVIVECLEFS